MQLLDLQPDLLGLIASKVTPYKDRLNLKLINRYFNQSIIRSAAAWQDIRSIAIVFGDWNRKTKIRINGRNFRLWVIGANLSKLIDISTWFLGKATKLTELTLSDGHTHFDRTLQKMVDNYDLVLNIFLAASQHNSFRHLTNCQFSVTVREANINVSCKILEKLSRIGPDLKLLVKFGHEITPDSTSELLQKVKMQPNLTSFHLKRADLNGSCTEIADCLGNHPINQFGLSVINNGQSINKSVSIPEHQLVSKIINRLNPINLCKLELKNHVFDNSKWDLPAIALISSIQSHSLVNITHLTLSDFYPQIQTSETARDFLILLAEKLPRIECFELLHNNSEFFVKLPLTFIIQVLDVWLLNLSKSTALKDSRKIELCLDQVLAQDWQLVKLNLNSNPRLQATHETTVQSGSSKWFWMEIREREMDVDYGNCATVRHLGVLHIMLAHIQEDFN